MHGHLKSLRQKYKALRHARANLVKAFEAALWRRKDWEDSGPDPDDAKQQRRIWKWQGAPPAGGKVPRPRRQIRKPGTGRGAAKQEQPQEKTPMTQQAGLAGLSDPRWLDVARRMNRVVRDLGAGVRRRYQVGSVRVDRPDDIADLLRGDLVTMTTSIRMQAAERIQRLLPRAEDGDAKAEAEINHTLATVTRQMEEFGYTPEMEPGQLTHFVGNFRLLRGPLTYSNGDVVRVVLPSFRHWSPKVPGALGLSRADVLGHEAGQYLWARSLQDERLGDPTGALTRAEEYGASPLKTTRDVAVVCTTILASLELADQPGPGLRRLQKGARDFLANPDSPANQLFADRLLQSMQERGALPEELTEEENPMPRMHAPLGDFVRGLEASLQEAGVDGWVGGQAREALTACLGVNPWARGWRPAPADAAEIAMLKQAAMQAQPDGQADPVAMSALADRMEEAGAPDVLVQGLRLPGPKYPSNLVLARIYV